MSASNIHSEAIDASPVAMLAFDTAEVEIMGLKALLTAGTVVFANRRSIVKKFVLKQLQHTGGPVWEGDLW